MKGTFDEVREIITSEDLTIHSRMADIHEELQGWKNFKKYTPAEVIAGVIDFISCTAYEETGLCNDDFEFEIRSTSSRIIDLLESIEHSDC